METIVAKSAGFCFGVQRAVDTVYKSVKDSDKKLYTYGPIIHNKEVVNDFERLGVSVIDDIESIPDDIEANSSIIIRSHGVTKYEIEFLQNKGFNVIDATCPFVKKIHTLVAEYSSKGYHIVLFGNPSHPEVCGIVGWAQNGSVTVINERDQIEAFSAKPDEKICIVSQTTFNLNKFKEFVEIISQKGYDILVLNTICNATDTRQKETASLAKQVDTMIVIGDKGSSNTQKLFEISKNECENTYYIQTSSELDYGSIVSSCKVGITAGASTPKNIIEEVSKNVRKL